MAAKQAVKEDEAGVLLREVPTFLSQYKPGQDGGKGQLTDYRGRILKALDAMPDDSRRGELGKLGARVGCFIACEELLRNMRGLDRLALVRPDSASQLHKTYELMLKLFAAALVMEREGADASDQVVLVEMAKGVGIAGIVDDARIALNGKFLPELVEFIENYKFLTFAQQREERLRKGEKIGAAEKEAVLGELGRFVDSGSAFISAYSVFLKQRTEGAGLAGKERKEHLKEVSEYLDWQMGRAGGKKQDPAALTYLFLMLGDEAAEAGLPKMLGILAGYSERQVRKELEERQREQGEGKGVGIGIGYSLASGLSLNIPVAGIGEVSLGTMGSSASLFGFDLLGGGINWFGAISTVYGVIRRIKKRKAEIRAERAEVDSSAGAPRVLKMLDSVQRRSKDRGVFENVNKLLDDIEKDGGESSAYNFMHWQNVTRDETIILFYTILNDPAFAPVFEYGVGAPRGAAASGGGEAAPAKKEKAAGAAGDALRERMEGAIGIVCDRDSEACRFTTRPADEFADVKARLDALLEGGFSQNNLGRMVEFANSLGDGKFVKITFDGVRINTDAMEDDDVLLLSVVFGDDYDRFVADLQAVVALANVRAEVEEALPQEKGREEWDMRSAFSSLAVIDYFLALPQEGMSKEVRDALKSYRDIALKRMSGGMPVGFWDLGAMKPTRVA